jgi:hypothetical protein
MVYHLRFPVARVRHIWPLVHSQGKLASALLVPCLSLVASHGLDQDVQAAAGLKVEFCNFYSVIVTITIMHVGT